jgi:hypothetical protein
VVAFEAIAVDDLESLRTPALIDADALAIGDGNDVAGRIVAKPIARIETVQGGTVQR